MAFDDFCAPDPYEELYFRLLDRTAGPGEDEAFDSLPEALRGMFVAAIFDMEIQNGGLCQFFANEGLAMAPLVGTSLRLLGLAPMAELYEGFARENGLDLAHLDGFQCETVEDFCEMYTQYSFDPFDEEYMRLWKSLDFNARMLDFAEAHPEAFA